MVSLGAPNMPLWRGVCLSQLMEKSINPIRRWIIVVPFPGNLEQFWLPSSVSKYMPRSG